MVKAAMQKAEEIHNFLNPITAARTPEEFRNMLVESLARDDWFEIIDRYQAMVVDESPGVFCLEQLIRNLQPDLIDPYDRYDYSEAA